MATAIARSNGANARAIEWDDEEGRQRSKGNWLPLEALDGDDDMYAGGPTLRQTGAAARPAWAQPTPAARSTGTQHARTAIHPQQRAATQKQPQISVRTVKVKSLAVAAGLALFALAAYVGVSSAVAWAQVKMDDLQYGRPRTMQMDAYVGHSEAEGMPSHFIAMNLNRRVMVLQMQSGDPAKVTTIVGPYLFGQGEDLTPVQLDVRDANTDGKPDLIVAVKSEQLLYLNDGGSFRLATPDERAAIAKAQAQQSTAPREAGTSGEGTK
jgi:hypothetical protein